MDIQAYTGQRTRGTAQPPKKKITRAMLREARRSVADQAREYYALCDTYAHQQAAAKTEREFLGP